MADEAKPKATTPPTLRGEAVQEAREQVDQATRFWYDQGVMGGVIVLETFALAIVGWIASKFYRDMKLAQKDAGVIAKDAVLALKAAADNAERLTTTINQLAGFIQGGKNASKALTAQLRLSQTEIRHSLRGVRMSLKGIARRLGAHVEDEIEEVVDTITYEDGGDDEEQGGSDLTERGAS